MHRILQGSMHRIKRRLRREGTAKCIKSFFRSEMNVNIFLIITYNRDQYLFLRLRKKFSMAVLTAPGLVWWLFIIMEKINNLPFRV